LGNWNSNAIEERGKPEYPKKTGVPGEKPLEAEKRTNNKLNPHMTRGPGIEPGQYWWEASALTTAPSLLPIRIYFHIWRFIHNTCRL